MVVKIIIQLCKKRIIIAITKNYSKKMQKNCIKRGKYKRIIKITKIRA
jgi:hypothetical protein